MHKSVYWIGMNVDTENHIKTALHVLTFSKHNWKEKLIHHEIPGKPWEVIGVDMFNLCNRNYLHMVDYHGMFSVIKKMKDLSVDSLILAH